MSIYEWLSSVAAALLTTIYCYGGQQAETIYREEQRGYIQEIEAENVGGTSGEIYENINHNHEPTNKEEIKEAIRREFAGLGEKAVAWGLRVARCESTYRHRDSSGNILFNGSCCYGILQFNSETYAEFCGGNVLNSTAIEQIRCARKMYEQGLQHHWECK